MRRRVVSALNGACEMVDTVLTGRPSSSSLLRCRCGGPASSRDVPAGLTDVGEQATGGTVGFQGASAVYASVGLPGS